MYLFAHRHEIRPAPTTTHTFGVRVELDATGSHGAAHRFPAEVLGLGLEEAFKVAEVRLLVRHGARRLFQLLLLAAELLCELLLLGDLVSVELLKGSEVAHHTRRVATLELLLLLGAVKFSARNRHEAFQVVIPGLLAQTLVLCVCE